MSKRKKQKQKQKQKLGKQRISRTAENQLMGVQVQNPDLIVRRGGACLFVCFFLIKNVLEPRLPSTGTLRIFLLYLQDQGRQTSHILCLPTAWYSQLSEKAEGSLRRHP